MWMYIDDEEENELETSAKMSFLDHLEELRHRLIVSLSAVAIGFLVCWAYSGQIYNFLAVPITQHLNGRKLVFTNPTDPFTIYMKVALIAGIFLTSPIVLWQEWVFFFLVLFVSEKKFFIHFIFYFSLHFFFVWVITFMI